MEREPGDVHAPATSQRTSSSTKARSSRYVSVVSVKIVGDGADGRPPARLRGTRRAWDLVADRLAAERYRPLALDLRGHGDARDRRPIGFAECAADVAAAAPDGSVLCGYSMGGRIALHVALADPGRVARLVLVATTAGIEDPSARGRGAARTTSAWPSEIEDGDIEAFADRWMAQPLFAGTSPRGGTALARGPAAQRPARAGGRAARRRSGGDGAALGPAGRARDARHGGGRSARRALRELGRRLARALPDARLELVPGAGHGLPREAPGAVAAAIATG